MTYGFVFFFFWKFQSTVTMSSPTSVKEYEASYDSYAHLIDCDMHMRDASKNLLTNIQTWHTP